MRNQIEEVKEKTDIVQIIGESVKLNKAGTNYKGLCPFHNEKSPSFMVSQELQIYKCFGCGAGGDVFTFLQEYEGMEFSEALKYLANKAGVKLEPIKGSKTTDNKERLLEMHAIAVRFYQYILLKHPTGSVGREYLQKRGIQQKTIEQFMIGFSPNKVTALTSFLKTNHHYSDKELIESGLVVQTQRGLIDRFRGRVIFPIVDHRGNAIALAGRILPEFDTGKVGKYINSPETPIYHKSKSLYGIFATRSAIKRAGKAVVVEGEVDAISSWQAGIQNVVAIKGSALTEEQVLLLSRYARTFVLALDADFAGNNAALKAITQAQLKGVDILVADMHPHKDPDEFAQKDSEGYKKALENAIGIWDFIINVSLNRHDASSGEGKAAISRELTPVLATIPDKIVQSHYIGLLAQKLSVPTEAVAQQVYKNAPLRQAVNTADKAVEQSNTQSRREVLEEKALSLAFQSEPSKLVNTKLVELLTTPILVKIAKHYLDSYPHKEKFDSKEFFESLPAEIKDKYSQIILKEEYDDVNIEKELKMTVHELEIAHIKAKIGEAAQQISKLENTNQDDKLAEVQRDFNILTKRLAQLQEEDI